MLYQQYIYQNSGRGALGGDAARGLLDGVALRRRDTDGDGVLDETLYYIQNTRGDVTTVLRTPIKGVDPTYRGDGNGERPIVVERYRYSVWGIPTVYAAADINMDGVVDKTDNAAMRAAVRKFRETPSRLVPRGDINQDGRVDIADMKIYFQPAYRELMNSGGNGREQLSYGSGGGVPEESQWYRGSDAYQQTHLDNRLGFAGYVWDPWLKVYHVRHRVYDPFDTRWLQADPIGYAGGDTDLRRYCNGDPINYIDPLGLWGTQDPAPPDGGGAWNSGPMIPSWIHTTLDVVGFVPGVGTAADIANGGLYAIDGEWDEAGLSLVGAIPVIGDAIAGTRKGIKAANKIDDAVDAAKGAEAAKGVNNAEDAASKAGNPKKPDDAGKKTDGEGCGKPDDGPKKSNQEKGKIGESEADKYYESQGYEKLNSKVGSDNGFDGVYVKRDKDGNITEMVLNESKYSDSGRFKLSTSEAGKQMSDPWIKNTLDRMERSTDPSVSNTGAAIREAMQRGVVRTRGTLSTPSGPMTPGTIMPGGRFIADPSQ